MTRIEALIMLILALIMITVALTWLFGAFGLLGSGLVLAVTALVVPERKAGP